ncbi:hypothetical protein B0H13DRAFT_1850488 [Mycena leptocephala]|nr:hypothetical protein B0H13DRAFT_1850488 [Mycena leptocephala]
MTLWLQRQEAFALRESYLSWLEKTLTSQTPEESDSNDDEPPSPPREDRLVTSLPGTAKFPNRHDRFAVFKQLAVQLARNRYIADKPLVVEAALVIENPDQYSPSAGIRGLEISVSPKLEQSSPSRLNMALILTRWPISSGSPALTSQTRQVAFIPFIALLEATSGKNWLNT